MYGLFQTKSIQKVEVKAGDTVSYFAGVSASLRLVSALITLRTAARSDMPLTGIRLFFKVGGLQVESTLLIFCGSASMDY